jgi:hypothetical protein
MATTMRDLASFVMPAASAESDADLIQAAADCLDRFTAAFNACDTAAMDGELHFPHIMLSGAMRVDWPTPGQHPADFFDKLKATGWALTQYLAKEAVLVSPDKVHFVVVYTRADAAGNVLSTHRNLWIATRVAGRWGISLRSY